jgi:hypothetical protein
MTNPISELTSYNPELTSNGPFYVIKTFPNPQFINEMNGELKIFEWYDEAKSEADNCQQGYVLTF